MTAVPSRATPTSTAAAAAAAATAEADADAQAVVQLVNRFVLSTVQFLNRFAEECESRLVHTSHALTQLELQAQLLEHLLLSSGTADAGAEGESGEEGHSDNEEDDAASYLEAGRDDGSDASAAAYDDEDGAGRGRHQRHRSRNDDDAPLVLTAHPSPNGAEGRRQAPPAPGALRKGPPRPPPGAAARAAAAAQEEAAARAATLAIVGAPVLLPSLAADAAPPPPPPPLELRPGRLPMRQHPRLRGYFELLALRVPAALVKAKMQVDGHQPEWLDTPDAPAPGGLSAAVRAFVDEPD